MKLFLMRVILFGVLVGAGAGCVYGIRITSDSDKGGPTGSPGGAPDAIRDRTPRLGFLGSVSGVSESENFRGYGSLTSFFAGRIEGEGSSAISPQMDIGEWSAGGGK